MVEFVISIISEIWTFHFTLTPSAQTMSSKLLLTPPAQCDRCNKTFLYLKGLTAHIREKHDANYKPQRFETYIHMYTCTELDSTAAAQGDQCNKAFLHLRSLTAHIREKHDTNYKPPRFETYMYICKALECHDKRPFKTLNEYRNHLQNEHHVSDIACESQQTFDTFEGNSAIIWCIVLYSLLRVWKN